MFISKLFEGGPWPSSQYEESDVEPAERVELRRMTGRRGYMMTMSTIHSETTGVALLVAAFVVLTPRER